MSQRQCLPIDENESSDTDSELNFDLDNISAHKYLKNVRLERERTKEIVSVEIPKNFISDRDQNQQITSKRQFQTKEWQEHQKELFDSLRKKICELRNLNNEEKLLKELPINVDDEDECIQFCRDNEPLLSTIFTFDSFRQIENLVEILSDYFTECFEELKLKDWDALNSEINWIGKWIYALMACLRIPLSPEVHNSIRMIAKNCINLIDHIKSLHRVPDDSCDFLPLNLLVSIIVNNFNQHDLLMSL